MIGKIKINGIDIEVADQDELNEMADEGKAVIACMPAKFGRSAVPDSRIVQCEQCKQDVWISPATYSTWQSCAAPIVCLECCAAAVKKEKE